MENTKAQLEVYLQREGELPTLKEINHLYQCILVHTLKYMSMFSLYTYPHLKINTTLLMQVFMLVVSQNKHLCWLIGLIG